MNHSGHRQEQNKKHEPAQKKGADPAYPTVNFQYKARLFEMVFSQKEELLSLYNAVNGSSYDDPGLLTVNTLKNAIYMSMHNDISFLIDTRLYLYEHQSTLNPNLPLRFLEYVSDLYSVITKDDDLYGSRAVSIPSPRFIVFYNGRKPAPERLVLKLSDLYTVKEDHPSLELEALMLNINPGFNPELKHACRTLDDYVEYTSRIRAYAEDSPIEDAVERATRECIEEDILSDFLLRNRREAVSVSIYEYDEEKHMKTVRSEGYDEGHKFGYMSGVRDGKSEGLAEGKAEGLAEGKAEGLAEGEVRGAERMGQLCSRLLDTGRSDEIQKALQDSAYRNTLYEEFGL